jgi:branched-chain amino acid transport system ATP-binding protein
VLEVRDLRVAYGAVEVLHGIDLSLASGEVVGLIGPNGGGKTSTLRALCGLRRPSSGVVEFEQAAITGLTPEEIARRGLALVPEGRQIFKTLTVKENLVLASRGRDSIEDVVERFPVLTERARQRADRLSGGEQQQLALAMALSRRPKLLALDEPSLGLAPRMIDAVYDLLAQLRAEGMTMLLVEQNVARTTDFCDRSVVLAGGRVQAQGSRDVLRRNPDLLHAYLGRQP